MEEKMEGRKGGRKGVRNLFKKVPDIFSSDRQEYQIPQHHKLAIALAALWTPLRRAFHFQFWESVRLGPACHNDPMTPIPENPFKSPSEPQPHVRPRWAIRVGCVLFAVPFWMVLLYCSLPIFNWRVRALALNLAAALAASIFLVWLYFGGSRESFASSGPDYKRLTRALLWVAAGLGCIIIALALACAALVGTIWLKAGGNLEG
jgi:hypothetical protein